MKATLEEQIQEYINSNRIIYLLDPVINQECCAEMVMQLEMYNGQSHEPITIKVVSNDGGDWYAGISVYSCIRRIESPVNVEILGSASSMATIFCQSANKVCMSAEASFMVHAGSSELYAGSHLNLISFSKYSEVLYDKLLSIYLDRCRKAKFFEGKSDNHIKSFIDKKFRSCGDWYLTADEALKYGFIDEII